MRAALFTAALLLAGPSLAQEAKVWTAAPVPNVSVTPAPPPADRAGRSSGPDNAAPFSGVPTGSTAAGATAPASPGADAGTPSLAR